MVSEEKPERDDKTMGILVVNQRPSGTWPEKSKVVGAKRALKVEIENREN